MLKHKHPEVLLECPLKLDWQGTNLQLEAAVLARITDITLELLPKYGNAFVLPLREILEIRTEEYRITLVLADGTAELFHLGSKFTDFVRILYYQRNELMVTDLLMREPARRSGIQAVCTRFMPNGEAEQLGSCELRLCNTALIILPEHDEPVRVPFSYMSKIVDKDYVLIMEIENGTRYQLSRLGREFQPFTDLLSQLMNELSVKAQELVRALVPTASLDAVQRAASLMREGRAVRRQALEEIDPLLWTTLEKQLDKAGLSHEYKFLTSHSAGYQQCIGFKRELVSTSSSEYIWFLIPIYSHNVVAMEASTGPRSGRATYFFRIVPRNQFLNISEEQIAAITHQFLTQLNHAMMAINFRREPIYLSEDSLTEPRYQKYQLAIRKIPGLQELRTRFIGRVFHREPGQWQEDVLNLLDFNISTNDDSPVWIGRLSQDIVPEEEKGG